MTGPSKALLAATLLALAGCQAYVDAQGRTHLTTGPVSRQTTASPAGPGEAYMPDPVIVEGVRSFQTVYRQDGMAGVQIQVTGCRNSVLRHVNADAIPHCFAFDVAAFEVVVSHDRVHHAAPLPNLDVAVFRRRFALYQQALAVPQPVRQQVEDSVFQRVGAVLGANAS